MAAVDPKTDEKPDVERTSTKKGTEVIPTFTHSEAMSTAQDMLTGLIMVSELLLTGLIMVSELLTGLIMVSKLMVTGLIMVSELPLNIGSVTVVKEVLKTSEENIAN